MKRKYLLIPALAIIIAAIAVTLFCIASETKEYKYSNSDFLFPDTYNYQTGGSLRMTDLDKYRIVYGDSFGEDEIALVQKLADLIREHTGFALEIYSTKDGKHEDSFTVAKHEILLGYTYRPEHFYLKDQIWNGAASCTMIGKKLVLAIGSNADTLQILNRFIELVETNCQNNSEYFFKDSDTFLDSGDAPVRALTINGLPITEYTIVNISDRDSSRYTDNAYLAEVLRERIASVCGYLLPMQEAEDGTSPTAGTIRIGIAPTIESLFDELFDSATGAGSAMWSLSAEANVISVLGTESHCTAKAMNAFMDRLTPPAPIDTYEVQIAQEEAVSADTDITLSRIDMMDQWPSGLLLEEDVCSEWPDLYILENAVDSLGYSVIGDFKGYYSRCTLGYAREVYYCSDRFNVTDEEEIHLPEDADHDNTLHGQYIVLKDSMTSAEIVIFTSDVTENTLDEFEQTVQYLCYPDREIIYLGSDVPNDAANLFADASDPTGASEICTFVTEGIEILAAEDRTEDLLERYKDESVIWNGKGAAHFIRLQIPAEN